MHSENLEPGSALTRLLLRVTRGRYLTISLLGHLLFVIAFGGITLFYRAAEPADFLAEGESFIVSTAEETQPPGPATPDFGAVSNMAAVVQPDSGSQALSAITAMAAAPLAFSLPTAPVTPHMNMARTFQTSTGSGTGVGSSFGAGGFGSGTGGGGGGGRGGTLFGKKVEAQNLGVILDRSGSAKPYLARVLGEIKKDFANATIVTLHGCGIGSDDKKLEAEKIGGSFNIKGVKNSEGKEVDIGKEIRSFREAYNIDNGTGKTDTEHAIKKLLDEKVDAIYWFADFGDPVDEAVAEKLTKELKDKNVKLVLHSFKGKDPPQALQEMVKKLHGDVIKAKPED